MLYLLACSWDGSVPRLWHRAVIEGSDAGGGHGQEMHGTLLVWLCAPRLAAYLPVL